MTEGVFGESRTSGPLGSESSGWCAGRSGGEEARGERAGGEETEKGRGAKARAEEVLGSSQGDEL